jgi:diacylglycerol kinase family enzyme
VDDGLLDFWLISGRTVIDVVYRTVQVLLGAHTEDPGIAHFQSREATFESDAGIIPMHVDGEPIEMNSPIHFRIHSKSLRVLVPEAVQPEVFTRGATAAPAP